MKIILLFWNLRLSPEYTQTAIDERRWKSDHSLEDLQESLVHGCITALQLGGPVFGFALHSTVHPDQKLAFPGSIRKTTIRPDYWISADGQLLRI